MNHLHRCALRFPRTAAEAFRDHTYGAAIEKPAQKPGIGRWLFWSVLGFLALVAISWRA